MFSFKKPPAQKSGPQDPEPRIKAEIHRRRLPSQRVHGRSRSRKPAKNHHSENTRKTSPRKHADTHHPKALGRSPPRRARGRSVSNSTREDHRPEQHEEKHVEERPFRAASRSKKNSGFSPGGRSHIFACTRQHIIKFPLAGKPLAPRAFRPAIPQRFQLESNFTLFAGPP